MKKYKDGLETFLTLLSLVMIFFCANGYYVCLKTKIPIVSLIIIFAAALGLILFSRQKFPEKNLKICKMGVKILIVFVVSIICTLILNLITAILLFPDNWHIWTINAIIAYLVEAIVFWIGIICVYCTSIQLGIKIRVWGLICGMIPVFNLIMLSKIIKTTMAELDFEWKKYVINCKRKYDSICATKYPLLMVHGVFFRDSVKFNYWGRIPKELELNGATIFYGEHQSASSVEDCAAELAEKIKTIIKETGCEKINIIAHSKGGLDCRYAIHEYKLEEYIASLTTINTPHRGCKYADYLLGKAPDSVKNKIANAYNRTLRKLGDTNPDFIAGVTDLSSERCSELNAKLPQPENIFCQSVGSKLNSAVSGQFPLNLSYNLVKKFDGFNDGLVGEDSAKWGDEFTFLSIKGRRGISHGDMIDLNRENIPGFDVREWYVNLVSDLKNRGL